MTNANLSILLKIKKQIFDLSTHKRGQERKNYYSRFFPLYSVDLALATNNPIKTSGLVS